MKRHGFGINLDEGYALTTDQEFGLLFVDLDPEATRRLVTWLESGDRAVVLGGQIGCGKTTQLEVAFHKSQVKPDLVFHFDRRSLNLGRADCWYILFTELFGYIAAKDLIGALELPGPLMSVLGKTRQAWRESVAQLRLEPFSEAALEKTKRFSQLLESNLNYLPDFFESILKMIQGQKGAPLVLVAAGIDKFEPGSAAYFSLREVIQVLLSAKTLFEMNAVHLFKGEPWTREPEKIFVVTSERVLIEEMLRKRLGVYAKVYAEEIPLLAAYSGGVPRQALRLLDAFLTAKKLGLSRREALARATRRVYQDFFVFAPRPKDALMKSVSENSYLEAGWVGLPFDEETARLAVFGNWLVLEKPLKESRWQTSVNPLVKGFFVGTQPEEPERVLLKAHAEQRGVSEQGLEVNLNQSNWQEALLAEIERPLRLNLTEVLDSISGALLSGRRLDRIIIAFKNRAVAKVVRLYFGGKINAHEDQVWHHCELQDGTVATPLEQMIQEFSSEADVHSFEWVGDFSCVSLDVLNLRRDWFVDKQLIWWVPEGKLKNYLSRWTQLRQLFQVYVLEEDLAKTLSVEELEADLKMLHELNELEERSLLPSIKNLEVVLKYLKGATHGENE